MGDSGAAAPRGRQLIIGIGNTDRGDDAVGRIVARQLRARQRTGVEIFEESGEAASLLSSIEGAGAVWFVDAAVSGAAPGTIRRFDVAAASLPQAMSSLSTHGFGLAEAIELARALKRLPSRCIVYTVEICACEAGALLTPDVAAAVEEVVARVCAEIERLRD